MNQTHDGRMRTPPLERFSPPEEVFDIDVAAAELLAEPGGGQHGHRQVALFRHGPATLALYCFETKGAKLPDHVVDGMVIIQVLKGRLNIHTDQADYDLPSGQLLRLAPGVRHDVVASEPSQMLLTVCVEGSDSRRG